MVPFENLSALTHAVVELLTKVDSRHRALGPKITEVVTVILVVTSLNVNSKTLLEFNIGSKTVFSVAFPVKQRFSMKGGSSGKHVTVPADMVSWFSEKYSCCIVLPRWLVAS